MGLKNFLNEVMDRITFAFSYDRREFFEAELSKDYVRYDGYNIFTDKVRVSVVTRLGDDIYYEEMSRWKWEFNYDSYLQRVNQ